MILKQLGCCENRQPFCVYVVGAGGKTSWIHFLAKQERAEGKRVLILTSTHMYEPKEWVSVRGKRGVQDERTDRPVGKGDSSKIRELGSRHCRNTMWRRKNYLDFRCHV